MRFGFSQLMLLCLCFSFSNVNSISTLHAEVPSTNGNATKQQPKKKPAAKFAWLNPVSSERLPPGLSHGKFDSKLVQQQVGYYVLTPPGYEESASNRAGTRFPVVYYLHGGRPGSEKKGISLAPYLHEAMKSKKVAKMIYVFVNGGPVSHYNVPDRPGAVGADVFIEELIPHIDQTYRTIADRRGRGLEGFSQGGRGTMRLSLRYPELFSSVAAGGGGYETEKRISLSEGRENDNLKFALGDNTWDLARAYSASDREAMNILIYVGTKGFNYENNLDYMSFLTQQSIPFERLIVEGVPHSAKGIYEKSGLPIMRFHASNFGSR